MGTPWSSQVDTKLTIKMCVFVFIVTSGDKVVALDPKIAGEKSQCFVHYCHSKNHFTSF